MDARCGGLGVVSVRRLVRVSLARQVDRDDTVLRGEQRHHFAPGVATLREAGEQKHERAGAAFDDVESQASGLNEAVLRGCIG
jgi:hypothetical protein